MTLARIACGLSKDGPKYLSTFKCSTKEVHYESKRKRGTTGLNLH